MSITKDRIIYLLERYSAKTANAVEQDELFEIADRLERDAELRETVAEIIAGFEPVYPGADVRNKMLEKIFGVSSPALRNEMQKEEPTQVLRMFNWKRIAIAASIILAIGIGSYFIFFNHVKPLEVAQTQGQRFKNDVDPGKYKARLQLADGKIIVLDSAKIGELAKQGETVVINKNGQLVYQANGSNEVLYNTLSTARGETYTTMLADGSKVWLNSASSIKFPVSFTGNERRVEITGEAYFEVKHNEKMPFKVVVNGMEVQDLGTEFNINAYNDEAVITTTLVSGSAKVVKASKQQILSPGQQAQLSSKDEIRLVKDADVEQAIAWKNGKFSFDNADIEAIMRQVERWYDVDIAYEGKVSHHFVADIPRNTPISTLLKALELTERVHFRIEGKKVVVMP